MAVDLEGLLLQALAESPDAVIPDSQTWAQSHNLDPQAVVGALKSLLTDAYVTTEDLATSFLEFTKEAQQVVENGSPEFLVFAAIQNAGGLAMPDLQASVGKDVAKHGDVPQERHSSRVIDQRVSDQSGHGQRLAIT